MGSEIHKEKVPYTEQEVMETAEQTFENANVVEHSDVPSLGDTDHEEENFEDEPYSEPEFVPGDIVYLKSGSPALTYLRPSPSTHYVTDGLEVGWFTANDEYRTNSITKACLTHNQDSKFVGW